MRDLQVPENGSKRKLLDATERLVVEKGFDLVSVRDITGATKANVAAVNYHFGNREALMALVVQHVMAPLNEARTKALDDLAAKAGVEEIISATVRALFSAATGSGLELSFYLKLAGRVLILPEHVLIATHAVARAELSGRYCEALSSAVPKKRVGEIAIAWRFFEAGLAQSLVGLRDDDKPSVLAEQWIAIGVRALGLGKESSRSKKDGDQEMLFDF